MQSTITQLMSFWVRPSWWECHQTAPCRTIKTYPALNFFALLGASKIKKKPVKLWCAQNLHAISEDPMKDFWSLGGLFTWPHQRLSIGQGKLGRNLEMVSA